MFATLLERVSTRVVFVVGKGGVGKTTTSGAIALALADQAQPTHLISTDPAHSLRDLLPEPCSPHLEIEEFDARTYADAFFNELRAPFVELMERGTYLDAADAASFLDLSIPGIDEVMAALRLVELLESGAQRIVVDTAPTGHTLRLLDSAAIIDSWVEAGRAMADKAAAVASALVGQRVPLAAEGLLLDWRESARRFESDIVQQGSAIVVTRAGVVIEAETRRLVQELRERGLAVAATVSVADGDAADFTVDWLEHPHGCDGLRAWARHLIRGRGIGRGRGEGRGEVEEASTFSTLPSPIPATSPLKLVLVAGKGGVGKTTCACAIAAGLALEKRVCIVSTDPAGSLSEVLGVAVGADAIEVAPNLFARQIEAVAEFQRMRAQFRASVDEVFEQLGLHASAALDRKVIESLWDFAPPGLDEIISLIEILEHADEFDTTIIDSAPTGHFLRLIEMPDIALDWVRALMRLIVKYHAAGSLDALTHDLLAFAKRLKQLKSDLSTPGTTAVYVVTLDEPLVNAETARLSSALESAGMPVAATILNRADDGLRFTANERWIRAPDLHHEVVGTTALRSFLAQWETHGD